MAKKSLINKANDRKAALVRALQDGRKPKYPTRVYNRCKRCGRPHGYIRRFEMCRICVRELASRGEIMGLSKSSW
jgi:small subunit ribosomal protein S14